MLKKGLNLYLTFAKMAAWLTPVALLLIRLAWGWELIESGWGHLTHLQQTTDFFQSLGIPMPKANAIISGSMEFTGGVCWMLGLATRLISIPLAFNFCVAYLTASRDKVTHFFVQDPSNFIDDSAFPFLATSLLLIALGAGAISIDRIIKSVLLSRHKA
jgi:putative oxidoreductase